MPTKLKVHLKPNERIFINGAMLKVDRKVTVDILNEVDFILDNHVLDEDQATTPIRQLYFIVQALLTEPSQREIALQIYDQSHRFLLSAYKRQDVLEGLVAAKTLVEGGRVFDALKKLRSLFTLEDEILAVGGSKGPVAKAESHS